MHDLIAVRQPPQIETSPYEHALAPRSRYLLRGAEYAVAVACAVLGLPFSQVPCRATVNGDRAALWLGPDEYLFLAPEEAADAISRILQRELREIPHSLVDISHRQITLAVHGSNAQVLLNTGCPLDLNDESFPVGSCTRTVLAKASIILWRCESEIFHIEVSRSFAGYVSAYLREAAREFNSVP